MDKTASRVQPESVEHILSLLAEQGYIADRSLAVTLLLALKLGRPLFLEGEPGVGKTEIAKVLATSLGYRLIRMQCYEGIDVNTAVYEWNYPAQMLAIRLMEASSTKSDAEFKQHIYSEEFLIKRPLLDALSATEEQPVILLIDELDRADEPFEAYLLELLSDFQVSIPELGTVRSQTTPVVVLTSNRTREIHDAVKRRCFYNWVDYPDAQREYQIVKLKAPSASDIIASQVVAFVQNLRNEDLFKKPGVAESIDLANAHTLLGDKTLTVESVQQTLGVVLKYQDDLELMSEARISELLDQETGQN